VAVYGTVYEWDSWRPIGGMMAGEADKTRGRPIVDGTLTDITPVLLTPVVYRMSTVTPKDIAWFWPGRLAFGKITMLDGDPDLGKTTVALDIAMRVSRGLALPGGEARPPRDVLLLTDEDDDADTTYPRLAAIGADLDRVRRFTIESSTGERSIPEFPRDVPALLVIDPLFLYLGPEVNPNRDSEIRRVLGPIAKIAQDLGCAILCLRHFTKAGGTNPLHRGGGSVGIIGQARLGLMIARDPKDETGRTRILASTKHNISSDVPSLAYQLDAVPGTSVARVFWMGETSVSASSLMEETLSPAERGEQTEAARFLKEILDVDGPTEVKEIQRAARDAAIAWRNIERAKAALGVDTRRKGFGRGGAWEWYRPTVVPTAPHTPPQAPPSDHTPPQPSIDRQPPKPAQMTIDRHTPPYISSGGVKGEYMALYVCLGCGEPRSRSAEPCPNCGATEGEERS